MNSANEHKQCIRNVFVTAHVDHGKSTLVNHLLSTPGFTPAEVESNIASAEENPFKATITSNHISLSFDYNTESIIDDGENAVALLKNSFLIYLISSPGNIDFSSEALLPSLSMADGALVVVDCIEGVAVQTDILLCQAVARNIRPCLMINKLDRALLELQLTGEEIYQLALRSIGDVNQIINSNSVQKHDWNISSTKGSVVFGSGLHQWGFSLKTFAKVYASKFNTTEEKMTEKLWGDWVFHTADGKSRWIHSNSVSLNNGVDTETGAKRAFVAFIMDPIIGLCRAAMNNELTKNGTLKAHNMAAAVGVHLSEEVKRTLTGKSLFKYILQQWLPLSGVLLEMIVVHLPSPATAQSYRCETLCGDFLSEEVAAAVRACDSSEDAPLVLYLSKLNIDIKGRFTAIGRVLSGKLHPGQKVQMFDPNKMTDNTADGNETNVACMTTQSIIMWMGNKPKNVADISAGNIGGLAGPFDPSFGTASGTGLTAKLFVATKS
eukprot:gene9679-11379_t